MRYDYTIIGLMLLNSIMVAFTWAKQTVRDPENTRACALALATLFIFSSGWMIYAIAYDLNSKGAALLAVVVAGLLWFFLFLEWQIANQSPPEEEEKRYFLPPKE